MKANEATVTAIDSSATAGEAAAPAGGAAATASEAAATAGGAAATAGEAAATPGGSLREIVARHTAATTALAALGAALDARVNGRALDPAIQPRIDEVLSALGVRDEIDGLSPAELRPLLGEIRTYIFTGAELLRGARSGWSHTDAEILLAAGDVSALFPRMFARTIAPALAGLAERLAGPGARFLDVGTGVAALSIEMARTWPTLGVVGIEPWAPALALARERVSSAGLEARIELRHQAGEELADREAFDLAWVPSVFIREPSVAAIVHRVHLALRPGGWLLFPMMRAEGESLNASVGRLRLALFGGLGAPIDRVQALLVDEGMIDVHALSAPPGAAVAMIAARRRP